MAPRRIVKWKPELELTYGITRPSGPALSSACPLCVSFGRESKPIPSSAITAAAASATTTAAAASATTTAAAASATATVEAATAAAASTAAVPEPAKKKRRLLSKNVHLFEDFNSFRVKKHYRLCHPVQWAAYIEAQEQNGASKETNNAFFSQTKIQAHLARRTSGAAAVKISTAIGKLSKDLYAKETDFFARTESGIRLCSGEDSTPVDDEDGLDLDERASLHYLAVMPSLPTFLHVIFLVGRGLSFAQVADVIRHERALWQDVRRRIDAVNRREATIFTRLIAVRGLQALASVLKKCWTYSIAADGSTQIFGVAYFSIMVRIPPLKVGEDIRTLHVVAPPLRGSHTGKAMFDITAKTLGALESDWCPKLMGSTSDGAANMLGCELGWQTRLEEASMESGEDVFYKFHCGAHRLNLVNGKSMEAVEETDSEWIKSLHKIVKFTRKEANLIEEMGCQSPYHIDVRWSSLEVVLSWYRKHLDRLEAHYVEKEKEIAEDTAWWCTLILLHEHFALVGVAMKALQYRTLLMESQSEIFVTLRDKLVAFHGLSLAVTTPPAVALSGYNLTDDGLVSVSESGTAENVTGKLGRWKVDYASIWERFPDFGLDARDLFDTVEDEEDEERTKLVLLVTRDVAAIALTSVYYLDLIIEEEDKREMPPPTRPLPLSRMPVRDFQDIINGVKRRVVAGLGSNAPRQACNEQSELRRLVNRDGDLKKSFEDAATTTATFAECWAPAGAQFPTLRAIAAGFATIFPGSSPVESDFSLLRQDKSPQRSRMADLSVEGKFHARQWDEIEILAGIAEEMAAIS